MRNSVGNVLVHDGTREVLQLRMRLPLVSHRLNEWFFEVNGIVDVCGYGQVVTMPGEPLGHFCPIAHGWPIAPDIGFFQVRRGYHEIVSFEAPGGKTRPGVRRPLRRMRASIHVNGAIQRSYKRDVIGHQLAGHGIDFLADAHPALRAPLIRNRMRPALKILEAPLACIECIGSQPAGLIEWNA